LMLVTQWSMLLALTEWTARRSIACSPERTPAGARSAEPPDSKRK
jgi:hypothetical protein